MFSNRFAPSLPVLAFLLLASAAGAQNPIACMDQASPGFDMPQNPCNASDISIKEVVVGAIIDGCTNSSDFAQVRMDAVVELSGQGTRYDVSIFLNLKGGDAFSGIDQCYRDFFDPSVPEGTSEETGNNQTPDFCNDGVGSNQTDVDVLAELGPITIACADIAPALVDGNVDFSACVGYNPNPEFLVCGKGSIQDPGAAPGDYCWVDADMDGNPDIEAQFCAYNDQATKCGCSRQEVPGLSAPELTITKTCSPGSIGLAQLSTCTVTVTNSSTLAAADFTGFVDDYDQTKVFVTNISVPGGDYTDDNGDTLTWIPGGSPAIAGNVPEDTTIVMTYDVGIVAMPPDPIGDIFNEVCIWQLDRPDTSTADPSDTVPDVNQNICAQFTINVSPSAAVITEFEARPDRGGNRVEWTTGAETGTLALQLERWSESDQRFIAVGQRIDTLIQAPQGATYSVLDAGAPADATYRIAEVEADGRVRIHDLSETPRRMARESRRALRTASADVSADVPVRVARRSTRGPQRFVDSSVAKKKGQTPSGNGADRAVIEVDATGIQAVATTELADVFGLRANAVRTALRTERFRLHRGESELAWWTDRGATALYFHGTAVDNLDSRVTTYWLDFDNGSSPLGAQAKSSGSAVSSIWHEQRFEENLFPNVVLVRDPTVDFWFWSLAGSGGTNTLTFELDEAQAGSEAELEFEFFGYQVSPGATLSATLNGQSLGSVSMGSSGVDRTTFYAPPGVLQPGINTATFKADSNALAVAADALTVRYQRNLDSTDGLDFSLDGPTAVRLAGVSSNATLVALDGAGKATTLYRGLDMRAGAVEVDLPGGRFVVADSFEIPTVRAFQGELVAQTESADLIIVAHPSLLDGAQAFADYRSQQGLDVVVKTTTEVFDQYGNSEFGPEAIRRFTEETYAASNQELQALFLIGSGTFDGRSLSGFDRSLVPTKLRGVSWGILSSDRWFGDFDDNGLDEVAVGRFPAGSNEEVLAYLSRVQAYEASGAWAQKDLLLADNGDAAGNFPADSDLLVPTMRNPQKIYLGQTHTLAAARSELLGAWADGRRIINYYGHGGIVTAAHEGLLTVADLSNIGGAASNPLFLGITCNIGRFDIPNFTSLGEEMVLADDGAVAVWASSGLSTHSAVVGLSGDVVDALDDFGGQSLGEAVRKVTAAAGASARESGLTLLGDPMIRVP